MSCRRFAIAGAAVAIVACTGPSRLDPLEHEARSVRPVATPAIAPAAPPFEMPAPRDRIVGLGRWGKACVVRQSGHVDCWGGDADLPDTEVHRVPNVSDARAIDARAECVLRASGRVACFVARFELVDTEVANVAAFATGAVGQRDCFVLRDGHVHCNQRAPQLAAITDAIAISLAGDLACVVRRTGDVACSDLDKATPLHPIAGLGHVRALSLAGNAWAPDGCALLESGNMRCFAIVADEETHALRVEDSRDGHRFGTLDQRRFAGATQIAVGFGPRAGSSATVLELEALVDGKVVRWTGDNETVVLPSLTDAVQLVFGCALRAQGSVVCWGTNAGGALGWPTTIGRVRRPPRPVVGISDVSMLALAANRSVALTEDGTLYQWGLGARATPARVALPSAIGRILAIGVTDRGAVCVLAGRTTWCRYAHPTTFERVHDGVRSMAMIDDSVAVLRDDGTLLLTRLVVDGRVPPRPVPSPREVVSLVSAKYAPCGLGRDGRVWCENHSQWSPIPFIDAASKVSIHGLVGCAVRLGVVLCWTDTSDEGYQPVDTPAFTDAIDVAVVGDRTCVVRAGGKVVCWYAVEPTKPFEVLSGAFEVESSHVEEELGPYPIVGNPHGCAIMKDRTVTCWGSNAEGELGDGSMDRSDVPLGVPGL